MEELAHYLFVLFLNKKTLITMFINKHRLY